MRRPRVIALAVLAGLVYGSLLATGGYAWYLRSEGYRKSCATRLTESLRLPAQIGRVVPRSRDAREFQDVRVWLPERRGEAAYCRRAIVVGRPTADDSEAYELQLLGGRCEISTRTWLREDYRTVLESGLRPGFDPDGPRRVVFSGMDLTFEHERFRASLRDAHGVVTFEDPLQGRATVHCNEFNGHTTADAVALRAEFSPRAPGVRLDRVELVVPELPLAIVGLEDLAGLGLRTGSFSGRLRYREMDGQRELSVSGRAFQVQLAECTAAFFDEPWRGAAAEVALEELTVVDDWPERARFRGVFSGMVLGDILAPWGLAGVGGDLVLRVQTADVSAAGVDHLIAAGRCDDLDLEQVSAAVGWGRMTGRARVAIDDLTITQNQLTSLDAEIIVAATKGEPYWIERALLSEVLTRTLGFPLPEFLPERFEYTQFGVRLEVRDEVLYVYGTHGPREKTILTVSVGGQELPAVPEPEEPIDLRSWFSDLRTRLAAQIQQRLRTLTPEDAWRALSAPLKRPTPESE